MPVFPIAQVDAFTDQRLAGNPCAVVFDADDLSEAQMLAVAREMNLAETAFVLPSDEADFAARYFTPAEEIPLAGHPTLATAFALVDSGRFMLSGEQTTLTLALRAGPVLVDIEAADGHIQRIMMSQKKPQFLAMYDAGEVLPIFGLSADDVIPDMPVQTVSTGTPQLMVPLKSPDSLRQAQMDIPAYNAFRAQADFFSPHLFCLEGVTETGQTFARHFGTPPDLLEDPFTGSATGGMAAYLWRYGLIEQAHFVAEQGHWMQRPGHAYVEVVGPRDAIETVRVGGMAVVVLRGELEI